MYVMIHVDHVFFYYDCRYFDEDMFIIIIIYHLSLLLAFMM
jgi:hypothetical protein